MNVIITGAGGFIGRHLVVDQLRRGHNVTAVDIHTDSLQDLDYAGQLEILQQDFRDSAVLERLTEPFDICYHLASAHLETSVGETYFQQVNVEGAEALLRSCHEGAVSRFVHCSSVGVFGDLENPPADENTPCHPDNAYERSKLAGERAVIAYAQKTGYPVTVVRPAWVYGPGCSRTAKLFRSVAKGRFFYVGNGETLRHPIYIDDMVEAFDLAGSSAGATGEIYIIAGQTAVTIRQLATTIADEIDVTPPKWRLPAAPVWAGCYALELLYGLRGKNAPFSRRSMKFFTGNSAFSTTKAADQLGFKATTSLESGIAATYVSLNEN